MTKLTAVHHIGIPVPDLEASLAWYRDTLGLVDRDQTGGGSGPELSAALQVEGAELRFAFLQIGEVTVELLEYERPDTGKPFKSANNDVGTIHLCFEVDDIDAAYEDLTEKGVEFNAPPIRLGHEAGSLAGHAFAYFRDPNGIQLEIFELPKSGAAS